jgi:hypothetical protein
VSFDIIRSVLQKEDVRRERDNGIKILAIGSQFWWIVT